MTLLLRTPGLDRSRECSDSKVVVVPLMVLVLREVRGDRDRVLILILVLLLLLRPGIASRL